MQQKDISPSALDHLRKSILTKALRIANSYILLPYIHNVAYILVRAQGISSLFQTELGVRMSASRFIHSVAIRYGCDGYP